MELRGREGDEFTIIRKVTTVAAWMDNSECMGPTHQELMERLEGVIMTTTTREEREPRQR